MPQKFKIRKVKEVVKALETLGYKLISQKGSHMRYDYNDHRLTVPNHDEISIGTLNQIFKEAQKHTEKFDQINDLFLN